MRGSHFGKMYSITTFGESHGEAMGVVIDGMPSQIEININDLQNFVDKRKPGNSPITTSRKEDDKVIILSGIFNNQTLGTPICVIVKNTNQKSSDYDALKVNTRPGHADQTTLDKYGIRDHRGGGRASGRETVSRVIAGYFANLIIPSIKIVAQISQIADHKLINGIITPEIEAFLLQCKAQGESCGGKVSCVITGTPKGLGEPVFDKLKSDIGKAILSIGSCMGISFGLGDQFITALGSKISQDSKNFGGVEGGISNGEDIYFDAIFKAPSTVGKNAAQGRHDPCILPRVLPVIEAMATITIADHYLRQKSY